MASSCSRCSSAAPEVLLEKITGGAKPKAGGILETFLQKVKVNFGAELEEEISFEDANERYLSRHFPDLESAVYCCPPVFEYKHPGQPFVPTEQRQYLPGGISHDTLSRERMGELAEEKTVKMFSAMFKRYGIPSFIIHGYKWKTQYLKSLSQINVKISKRISGLKKDLFTSEGEVDLLISLPGRFLVAIEVKSVDQKPHICKKVKEGFSQSKKTVKFVSNVMSTEDSCSLVKVVAIPNCSESTVREFYCDECQANIVTCDDLVNVGRLHAWWQRLTTVHAESPVELSTAVYRRVVGRIIGPASFVKCRTTGEAIQGTADQIEKLARSYQFTPEQLSVKLGGDQFLFLYGPPGSGKTLVALWKATEIMNGNVSFEGMTAGAAKSVLYIIIHGEETAGLRDMYQKALGHLPQDHCDLFIQCREIEQPETYSTMDFANFVRIVGDLRRAHPGRMVHVICDECRYFPVSRSAPTPIVDWKPELGFVWLIADPLHFMTPRSLLIEHAARVSFRALYLNCVMRISRQNHEFANMILSMFPEKAARFKQLELGHAVNGPRPVVYRLKCICSQASHSFTCSKCTFTRSTALLSRVLKDLGMDSSSEDQPEITFLSGRNHGKKLWNYKVWGVSEFRGCEDKIVMIDARALADFDEAYITLTRSLGQFMIFDLGGSRDPYSATDFLMYTKIMDKIVAAGESGMVEIREIDRREFPLTKFANLREDILEASDRYKLDEMD